MNKIFSVVVLSIMLVMQTVSQEEDLTKRFNGTYQLLEAERGIGNKPTKSKVVQFGENNGTKLLAIAACEKCMPAVYTYQVEESKKYGFPIFFNSTGLYVLGYDKESFVIVWVDKKLGSGSWTKFSFSNFYSKSASKVSAISKSKIEDFAKTVSKKF